VSCVAPIPGPVNVRIGLSNYYGPHATGWHGLARGGSGVHRERAVGRYGDDVAQMYSGGIYDRSLAGLAIDPPPDDEYEELTYEEMRHVVRRLADERAAAADD